MCEDPGRSSCVNHFSYFYVGKVEVGPGTHCESPARIATLMGRTLICSCFIRMKSFTLLEENDFCIQTE